MYSPSKLICPQPKGDIWYNKSTLKSYFLWKTRRAKGTNNTMKEKEKMIFNTQNIPLRLTDRLSVVEKEPNFSILIKRNWVF